MLLSHNTVKPCFWDTRLIRTAHYLVLFALSLGKESPNIFSKFNLLNTDTPLKGTLCVAPSVSILTGFDCTKIAPWHSFFQWMTTEQ